MERIVALVFCFVFLYPYAHTCSAGPTEIKAAQNHSKSTVIFNGNVFCSSEKLCMFFCCYHFNTVIKIHIEETSIQHQCANAI